MLFDDSYGANATDIEWRVASVGPPSTDDTNIIRVDQVAGGIPVQGSEIVLVTFAGKLISAHGRLRTETRVPQPPDPFVPPADLVATGQARLQKELHLLRRTFDADLQSVVAEFAEAGGGGTFYEINESNGAIVTRVRERDELPLVTKTTDVGYYDDHLWMPTSTHPDASFDIAWEDASPLCRAHLDHDSNAEDGEPLVGLASGAYPSAASYAEVPCNSSDPIMTGFGLPSTRDGLAVNAYYWIHDLATFTRHWRAAYTDWTAWSDPQQLRVSLTSSPGTCSSGAACAKLWWSPFDFEYLIVLNRFSTTGSQSLRTFSHEYGHVVAFSYGLFGSSDFAETSLDEGFADHNTLRYAMFRYRERPNRPHDAVFETAYDIYDLPGRSFDHRYNQAFSNGEAVPIPFNGATPAALLYTPWASSTPCAQSNSSSWYTCGAVLSVVYWTLAWNQIRLGYQPPGYSSVSVGDQIITSAGYVPYPEYLANVAYTYAASTMPSGATIDDFFWKVNERYWAFFALDGFIDGREAHRVNQVFSSHCVGWNAKCGVWHRTAWQRLPQAATQKATWATTFPQEQWTRATDLQFGGTPARHSFRTPDGAQYVRFDSGDDSISLTTRFPVTGCYSFHAALQATTTASDSMWFRLDGGPQMLWQVERSILGGWAWSHSGPTVPANPCSPAMHISAGFHTVTLRYREPINIDALLVRRQP